MKNRKQIKSLLILISVIMASCMLVSGAMAVYGAVATGACTNLTNEGIEYLVSLGADNKDADKWRTNLTAEVVRRSDNQKAGLVSSIELKMANSSIRYQCTEVLRTDEKVEFSCNSLPINASITGVYIRYIPDTSITENTDIRFNVYQTANPDPLLMEAWTTFVYPPYPCARNYLVTKDFVAPDGSKLVYNTSSDCTDNKTINFVEPKDEFAMVNLIPGDSLLTKDSEKGKNRLRIAVTPKVKFDYTLTLTFAYFKDPVTIQTADVTYTYDFKTDTGTINADPIDGFTNKNLPLTLIRGTLSKIDTDKYDLWGKKDYPPNVDFDIKMWYENTEGTLGYENSVFHFERKLNVQFAPYCPTSATKEDGSKVIPGVIASTLYDVCDSTRQLFAADLTEGSNTEGIEFKGNTSKIPFYTISEHEPTGGEVPAQYFAVRKCTDAYCSSTTVTQAYPYTLTVSDGDHKSRTYVNAGAVYHKPGTTTVFKFRAYGTDDPAHGFALTGIRLWVDEPGTYVVYAFLQGDKTWEKEVLGASDAATMFYVTIPTNDSLTTCSTLANNGYFRALWNDCLDSGLTQLMPFEQIQGKEEAWVRNTSNHGVHFPYVSEWSYVPQQLEVASLTCKFEALAAEGRPGDGYCHPDDVYVPPYTKVTITGGTLYLASIPKYDDYYVAYARRDTYNISHLFFAIQVKECENLKKIPDTGISLRSPLKVQESVDAATSYVFTGNSLRIPAIGLGMETPIPIVHVYYNDGSADLGWDLSTLGNYVGELEGGSYIPYGGNSVLTGHYYSMGVFKNVEGLNPGDEVIVYANDGVKYIYKVVQKFIAQPTDVYEMFQQVGERSLTLVTCENYNIVTDEYERRTIVRAVIDSQDIYQEGVW